MIIPIQLTGPFTKDNNILENYLQKGKITHLAIFSPIIIIFLIIILLKMEKKKLMLFIEVFKFLLTKKKNQQQ